MDGVSGKLPFTPCYGSAIFNALSFVKFLRPPAALQIGANE
jgi:hypothetical protein